MSESSSKLSMDARWTDSNCSISFNIICPWIVLENCWRPHADRFHWNDCRIRISAGWTEIRLKKTQEGSLPFESWKLCIANFVLPCSSKLELPTILRLTSQSRAILRFYNFSISQLFSTFLSIARNERIIKWPILPFIGTCRSSDYITFAGRWRAMKIFIVRWRTGCLQCNVYIVCIVNVYIVKGCMLYIVVYIVVYRRNVRYIQCTTLLSVSMKGAPN